jgi:hypothetical protein
MDLFTVTKDEINEIAGVKLEDGEEIKLIIEAVKTGQGKEKKDTSVVCKFIEGKHKDKKHNIYFTPNGRIAWVKLLTALFTEAQLANKEASASAMIAKKFSAVAYENGKYINLKSYTLISDVPDEIVEVDEIQDAADKGVEAAQEALASDTGADGVF